MKNEMNQGWPRPSSSPHPHDNRRVGGTGVATGSCVSLSLCWCGVRESTGCTGFNLRHTTSCTPHVFTATIPKSLPPHARNEPPVVSRAIPRVIAENASPKLGPVAWTTRGRVHSSRVEKPHGKRSTRKQNTRVFPPASKTHQNCKS